MQKIVKHILKFSTFFAFLNTKNFFEIGKIRFRRVKPTPTILNFFHIEINRYCYSAIPESLLKLQEKMV